MQAMSLRTNSRCSVARSLEILGQKWNLLIVREAFLGRTRFAEFREIGIPSDILSARLAGLESAGILDRRPYQRPGERARDEYVLTAAGRDLLPVLAAFAEWGDEYVPTGYGPAIVYEDEKSGRQVRLAFVDDHGVEVDRSAVIPIRGPGAIVVDQAS
jgi:DNA-binding HxlR family transcriptional regulator